MPATAAGAVPARAGCGESVSPTTSGAAAHWDILCSAGKITVTGWVSDTSADGQCAAVKVHWADNSWSYSERACPEGTSHNFSLSGYGSIADVYLYEFDVAGG